MIGYALPEETREVIDLRNGWIVGRCGRLGDDNA
ncbi:unannotated protein [freshwater metagenome]|uniref:Unannotated protein n=1 Tax=freshwater metagenome TaxID=449393 RepID=A0A6J7SQ00_9ZZZZ